MEPSTSAAATTSAVGDNPVESEFYNTGRIGRRNALPDILTYNSCTTSTADLPERLSALTTKDDDETLLATASQINRNQPSTSQQASQHDQQIATTSTTGTPSDNTMSNT